LKNSVFPYGICEFLQVFFAKRSAWLVWIGYDILHGQFAQGGSVLLLGVNLSGRLSQ
jgi:hypothetical protein